MGKKSFDFVSYISFPLVIKFDKFAFLCYSFLQSKVYTCARFCWKAVTCCDQRWKSDREPNYIALTSVSPSVSVLTNKYKVGLWLYHIRITKNNVYMSKSLQIPSLIKNKAGEKVLYLIPIQLNTTYMYMTLPQGINTHKTKYYLPESANTLFFLINSFAFLMQNMIATSYPRLHCSWTWTCFLSALEIIFINDQFCSIIVKKNLYKRSVFILRVFTQLLGNQQP